MGVFEFPRGRGDGVLREPIRAADLLAVHVLGRVETLHLAGDLRLVWRGIETGDPPDTAPAMHEAIPGRRDGIAQGSHRPQAGDDDGTGHGETAAGASRVRTEPLIDSGSETL